MQVHDLGPHTFATPEVHARHHFWLSRFSPVQRREQMEDDFRARMTTAGIFASAFILSLITTALVFLLA
ncbi:MAG TPA: hypothetical protein VFE24_13695 [Pirellulales bacterium]|jgi:hypothetical protein|nr:hypothetical protein [Pirellulales bacterium]